MRKKSIISNKKIIALDFFCGCGGVTYGLRKAGIKVLAGFDNNEKNKYPYEQNNKGSKFINADIANKAALISLVNNILNSINHDYSIFTACAPCQPFSKNNRNYKDTNDSRRNLMISFIEIVKALPLKARPSFVFIENVGPMKSRGKKVLDTVITVLRKTNYCILDPKTIDTSKFGVPQRRKRLMLVAAKNTILKNRAIFNWDFFLEKYKENSVTVREVIEDLPRIPAGYQKNKNDPLHVARNLSKLNIERIKQISVPGGSRNMWSDKYNLECYKKHNGHTDVYGRMSWDEPAPTLTCRFNSLSNGRFGHPNQHRAISLREGAILQTLDNYKFEEPIIMDSVAEQIGNAVPPKLAKKFGNFFLELISKD